MQNDTFLLNNLSVSKVPRALVDQEKICIDNRSGKERMLKYPQHESCKNNASHDINIREQAGSNWGESKRARELNIGKIETGGIYWYGCAASRDIRYWTFSLNTYECVYILSWNVGIWM